MMHQTSCCMYLVTLVFYLSTWKFAAADDSYIILPVAGNVYPDEQYNVTIFIGDPPSPYTFDIDTGSDVTWVQCDAPCISCYPGPHPLYKKEPFDLVRGEDPICVALHHGIPENNDQCDYQVDYTGDASSLGVLVRDNFHLTFSNGTLTTQQITFGCGYDQIPGHKGELVDGIIGLGRGGSTILAQLEKKGVTRNFVGHCFSSAGGYLVIGAVPLIGIQWKKITGKMASHFYSLGVADIVFEGKPTNIKGLQVVFDSGSTYSYIPSIAYARLLKVIVKNLDLQRAPEDKDKGLSMCWKSAGDSGFRSIGDAASHFKTLALNFKDKEHGTEIVFEMPPTSYIILTDKGSACLGILNGADHKLDIALIGDISMQDKLVLYDNDNNQVGWARASCSTTP